MPRVLNFSVVEQVNQLCSRCDSYGHSREQQVCPRYFEAYSYCMPQLTRKCSRCNQPGHFRNNIRCSLFQQYPDLKYSHIVRLLNSRNREEAIQERNEVINRVRDERNNRLFIQRTIIQRMIYEKLNIIIKFKTIVNCVKDSIIHSFNYIEFDQNINFMINDLMIINSLDDLFNDIVLTQTYIMTDTVINSSKVRYINQKLRYIEECVSDIISDLNRERLSRLRESLMLNQLLHLFGVQTRDLILMSNIIKIKLTILLKANENNDKHNECSICYENKQMINNCETECSHIYCIDCIKTYYRTRENKSDMPCPLCRHDIKILNTYSEQSSHILTEMCE